MTAQPLSLASTALSEVIDYFESVGSNFDKEPLERLKNKAERALSSGIEKAAAFMALGIIYTYEQNLTKAGFYFKSANIAMPNNEVVVKNYAGHLKAFNLFEASVDVIVDFLNRNRSNFFPEAFRLALEYALFSGQYEKITHQLADMLLYCDENQKAQCLGMIKYATRAVMLDMSNQRTDETNIQAIKLISEFIAEQGHRVVDVRSEVLNDEHDEWIAYSVGVDTCDRAVVRKLNSMLCDWMAAFDNAYDLFMRGASFKIKVGA